MKSNAPGQLLGYALQFPRALYHLLRCNPDDVVCVEVLGDVATLSANGGIISEEDKSSMVGNPLTDRSTDLWKTFSNWIKAIINKDFFIEKTQFVLYCNQSGREGIVNKFSSARNKLEIQNAIQYAKDELSDVKPDHEIWNYYNFVVNENEILLAETIQKFELQVENESCFDDIRVEIQKMHIPIGQIEFVLENLCGWVQKVVVENIEARKSAIISWKEFDHQFSVLLNRSRYRELIDFSIQYSKYHEKVQNQVKIRPKYIQQLELIDLKEEEILAEISDYLRADINREKWIENEIINEKVALDFEERLVKFWENQRKRIHITKKNLEKVEQGQLLLIDCKDRQEPIREMIPPPSTIAGTYHTLADESLIGWHPDWETIFPKQKGE